MFLAGLFLTAFARSLASPVPIAVPGSTTPSPVCVVAAVITASRCDPTQTRTLFDILYSCIGVILLCTYISMHRNIPDQDDSWAKVTWLKLRTTLYALIVPELVMMWVIEDRGWTKTHGFFVQMGGLVQKESGGEVGYRVVCDPKKLTGMKIPCIPEKEIQDHGKGDLLAKAIVVIQTTWFVAQCIARRVQGLALTEIELVTLAFATLNVVTYGLWWNKPLNVGYPIYFDANGNRVDGPLADNDGPQIRVQEGAWYEKLWGGMKDYVAGCGEVWHRMKESWQASLRQQGVMKAIWEKVIMLPFSAVFAPLFDMITHLKAENRPTSVHPFYAASPSDSDHVCHRYWFGDRYTFWCNSPHWLEFSIPNYHRTLALEGICTRSHHYTIPLYNFAVCYKQERSTFCIIQRFCSSPLFFRPYCPSFPCILYSALFT